MAPLRVARNTGRGILANRPGDGIGVFRRPTESMGIAMMAMDEELARHRETWLGFTRLMKWTIAGIIIVLLGMALFLL
jgi:hypothetical protein